MIRLNLPWAILMAVLKINCRPEIGDSVVLYNGTKLVRQRGGWWLVYGYHPGGADVSAVYDRLYEVLYEMNLDSPVDMKKWTLRMHA